MQNNVRIALEDRGVLAVTGPAARSFLQGIVTNDVDKVDPARAIYAALLTPQGKFLFDFFIADDGNGGLLLDTGRDGIGDLARRLAFYRLRAEVEIADVSDRYVVTALIGDGAAEAVRLFSAPGNARRDDTVHYCVDPRLSALGVRCLHGVGDEPLTHMESGTPDDYQARRIALFVPEAGVDVVVGKSFILESNFEELNGVDFAKGCYVGQELTARTKYRGTVRRRLLGVTSGDALPAPGTAITTAGAEIGELRSACGQRGMALIRTDRLRDAGGDSAVVMAGDVRITPVKPDWLTI